MTANTTASLQTKNDKYYIVVGYYDTKHKRKQKWINTNLTVSGNNKRKAEQKRLEVLQEWQEKTSL